MLFWAKHLISDSHWYFILPSEEQCLIFSVSSEGENVSIYRLNSCCQLIFFFTCFFNFHLLSSLDLSLSFSLSQAQYCFICISKSSRASYLVILFLFVPGHTAEISSANPLAKLGTDSKLLDFVLWPQTLHREEALGVMKHKINLFLRLFLVDAQETTLSSMQPHRVPNSTGTGSAASTAMSVHVFLDDAI